MNTDFRIKIPGSELTLTLSGDDLLSVLGAQRKSIAWLAREIGETRPMVSMVIHGRRRSLNIRVKIERAIIKLLAKMPPEKCKALLIAA